jgi:hypothetical protein
MRSVVCFTCSVFTMGNYETILELLSLEQRPACVASALTTFRARYAWSWHDLARWLSVSVEQIHALAREPLGQVPVPAAHCQSLAKRHAADESRLASILS